MAGSETHRRRFGGARIRTGLGWTLLAVFSIGAGLSQSIADHPRRFEILYGIGFVGYLLLLAVYFRGRETRGATVVGLLVGAVLVRLPLLVLPCSNDVHRYLWEGRVQLAGHNPYAVAPDDPRFAELRDEYWERVNHPSYTAIYPPLTMMSCAAIAAVWPTPLLFKLVHTGFDLLAFALLMGWLRRIGKPAAWAIVYGLCPLTLTAFAGEGHNDSLMIATWVGAGCALAHGRNRLASILLGASMSCKFLAGLALPWFVRRHRGLALPAVVVLAVSFLPYLGARAGLFDSLVRFGTERTLLSLYHVPLTKSLGNFAENPDAIVRGLSAVVLIACALWAVKLKDFGGVACVTLGALLLTSPVVHYWYLTWVLAFVVFRPGWAWLAAAAAMGLYFEVGVVLLHTGQWTMPRWVGPVVWGAFLLAWCVQRIAGTNWWVPSDKSDSTHPTPPRRSTSRDS